MSKKIPIFIERDGKRYELVDAMDCIKHCSFAKKARKSDPGPCEDKCHLPRWYHNFLNSGDYCLKEVRQR